MSIYGPIKKKAKKKQSHGKDPERANNSDKNMLVTIRVRPLTQQEISNKVLHIVNVDDKLLIVRDKAEIKYEQEGIKPDVLHRSREQRYYFDKIFKDSSQSEVYENTCKQLIDPVTKGFNACVFAYGTTGSGKTYTMIGTKENPGNSVLIIDDMFDTISKDEEFQYEIKISYVEIYNEIIRDLLVVKSKDTYLDLRDDPIKGVQIAGVKEFKVTNSTEVMKLLTEGNRRRTTEATNANQTSSRSHAIFQIHVHKKEKTADTEKEILAGKLSLIDLAGSERGTVTENTGIRLREGAKINTSLLALANCINALGDKTKKGFYVSYRDSKLTRMLKDSLGGNCKTVMIATISPGHNQFEETINTLKYANRAKNIKIRAQANKKMVYMHISAYKNIISDLKDEIIQLKSKIRNDEGATAIDQINELEKEDALEEFKEEIDFKPKVNNLIEGEDEEESFKCECKQRYNDEIEKETIKKEISRVSEDILQLEQSLIELDEQNTMNAIEISKREAKILLLQNQVEENENNEDDIDIEELKKHIEEHQEQIEILSESTKQNLIKRQSLKEQWVEGYNTIMKIRSSIHERIQSDDAKEYLLLVIKCQFLESQNIQLLLNLQLQAKTISKYDKYFTNLSQNGIMPIESYDAMDDMLEEDEEEEDYDDFNSDEEEKTMSIADPVPTTVKTPASDSKEASNTTKSKSSKSKIPSSNPYLNSKSSFPGQKFSVRRNPYLVKQSKKK
ncbi:unnamed protein product [Moneuplotes crassus]|uniref:Kinesin-like protein n=1 Tax=Euplotes crassus TaxID=5936 RepID=A0AAD1U0P8_EUPCR|nr:unnamed protein product [Moneuplotes crassus]